MDSLNYRHLFLKVQEAGKSKIGEPAWLASCEDPLPSSQMVPNLLLCPHKAERSKALESLLHFTKALIIMRASIL